VRHRVGKLHRILHQSAHDAVLTPGGLVDQLAHAALLDGVDVAAALVQKPADDGLRPFIVAGDERAALHIAVDLARTPVLIEDDACGVAHGDGAVELVVPTAEIRGCHRS